MTRHERVAHSAGRALAVLGLAMVARASIAADMPDHPRHEAAPLSAARVLESLGPELPPPLGLEALTRVHSAETDDVADAIDQCVQTNMASIGAPGAAVAVMLDGELLYENGYGRKRRWTGDPVDADTVFRIGSITKQMTAAAVMQQVELGRVELTAPVTRYIPELEIGGRWPADSIAVWHTLTHTSGFPDWINEVTTTGDGALSTWAGLQSGIALHAPPSSFWNYSNPNFMIAGLVAERAAGVPYRRLFEDSLWQPAGMNSTTFDPQAVLAAGNWSYGHAVNPDTGGSLLISPTDNDLWAAGPAGFAFSTVGDLVRWALLLMDGGGPVLAPESAAAMQQPHQWTHYTPDLCYGFGIMAERYQGLDVRRHGGNVAGYGAYLLWVPERRFAVALLANVTTSLGLAAYCIVDEVLKPAPVEPPDLTTDPATWRTYEGDYRITEADGSRADARVYLEDDRLMVSIETGEVPGGVHITELVQTYLDTFYYDSDNDGAVDNDLTFIGRWGRPELVWWARSRYAVGERLVVPRRVMGRR